MWFRRLAVADEYDGSLLNAFDGSTILARKRNGASQICNERIFESSHSLRYQSVHGCIPKDELIANLEVGRIDEDVFEVGVVVVAGHESDALSMGDAKMGGEHHVVLLL